MDQNLATVQRVGVIPDHVVVYISLRYYSRPGACQCEYTMFSQ